MGVSDWVPVLGSARSEWGRRGRGKRGCWGGRWAVGAGLAEGGVMACGGVNRHARGGAELSAVVSGPRIGGPWLGRSK